MTCNHIIIVPKWLNSIIKGYNKLKNEGTRTTNYLVYEYDAYQVDYHRIGMENKPIPQVIFKPVPILMGNPCIDRV